MSLNVADYTTAELLTIIDLDENTATPENILKNTEMYIAKYQKSKPPVAAFFNDIQNVLLDGDELEEEKNIEKKDQKDTKKNKLFDNPALPIIKERNDDAISANFAIPVKQDSLNPNLKNTITRFLNLDSQFRQFSDTKSSAEYTCDLSDTLSNVLSMSVYSYQIPFSWYVIDEAYGNTCFWIVDNSTETPTTIRITMPPGNYSPSEFQATLNQTIINAGFSSATNEFVSYNKNNGLLTLTLFGAQTPDFTVDETTELVFYSETGQLQCTINCGNKSRQYFNSTLGWLMGFRTTSELVLETGNRGTAILDLNGTKYLILAVDDFNQNRINNSLVSIAQYDNKLKMPSYYNSDIPYTCIDAETTKSQLQLNTLLAAGKSTIDYTPTQVMLPSAPRTLTNAQLYTLNAINSNNNNLTNFLFKAPTATDILAIIPVKTSASLPTGSLLIEFSGSLQDHARTYFGPVNIERMAVKLLDDKGHVLNLNGNDWCVTLLCECLYQYSD